MSQLARLKLRLSGDQIVPNDDVLADYLESAKAIILNRRYPFEDKTDSDIPVQYLDLQVRIALELVAKMGAEGQVAHSENGVSRTYTASEVSPSLLREIVPKVGVGRP